MSYNKHHIKTGDRYGRLTCLKLDHIGKRYRTYFLFKCECGNQKVILGSGVVSGNTKSCGCLATQLRRERRISENHSEITAIILQYKRHAKSRGFVFNLSRKEVEVIVFKNCFYCGSEPSNTMKTKNSLGDGLKFNGIDRVNSKNHYEISNVVPCCKMCNNAKSNYSKEQFLTWAIKIYHHQNAMAEQWG